MLIYKAITLLIFLLTLFCFFLYFIRNDFKEKDIGLFIGKKINWENIRLNLRKFTAKLHTAGTKQNQNVALDILNIWQKIGLEDVHLIKYNVLLSYPNYTDPNKITIFDENTIVFENSGMSKVILPDQQSDFGAGIQWLAYSPNGTVEADVVYCHYGTKKDFLMLKSLGVSVKDKIALMRYQNDFRGLKVLNAQLNGAIGAILYTDPLEFANDGLDNVYPKTTWMPETGVQRGTIMINKGDPLTPLYPSIKSIFRSSTIKEQQSKYKLPQIPSLPISYNDAYQILSRLSGQKAPESWQGGLNITYRLGPGFQQNSLKFRMKVNSFFVEKEIQNVIGYIHGKEEPDEYVILGNHYDAWVYGSIDPNSATATLTEVARSFVFVINETNWRPLRTLVFCNWDAEEYGLVGSTEFVEEFANILSERAVVYLNVDLISENHTFNANTVPSLYDVVVDTSKLIENPLEKERSMGRLSIYNSWIKYRPGHTSWLPNYPHINNPGAGSDHYSFLSFLGIPVVDFKYSNITQRYPLYHSLYETHYLNENLTDTNHLKVHTAIGQYWTKLAQTFADAKILPINIATLAKKISNDYIFDLKRELDIYRNVDIEIKPALQQFDFLSLKSQEFLQKAKDFQICIQYVKGDLVETKHNVNYKHCLSASRINKRLKAIDRCFINSRDPNEFENRHVLYSLNANNSYKSSVFSLIYAEIEKFANAKTLDQKKDAVKKLAKQLSVVQYSIHCAISHLNTVV